MFKMIQKIERKKRLIFLSILSPILAVVFFFPVKETIELLPSGDFLCISLFAVFLYETFDTLYDLKDELKKERLEKHIIGKPEWYR